MSTRVGTAVLVALFREEWRLHAELFGGRRFLAFPVVVAVLAAAGTATLAWTGTSPAAIVVGVHLLAVVFGLYGGTAGFAGSDALENVLGPTTLLLSTGRLLPLSRRWLLGAFLLKDAVYYGVLFVLPMAVSVVPLVEPAAAPLAVLGLWGSLLVSFLVGMAVTVVGISARTRGFPVRALVALAVGVGAALAVSGSIRPIGELLVIYPTPAGPTGVGSAADIGGVLRGGTLLAAAVATVAVALAAYDPSYGRPSRSAGDRLGRLDRLLPLGGDGLAAKSLLDLSRSTGGLAKPLVSAGILLALVIGLVGVVEGITGTAPSSGILLGSVLGLTAFTTYSWLTQFDSVEEYLILPVGVEALFDAKRRAFAIVGIPTAVVAYLLGIVAVGTTRPDALAGVAVLVGYAIYYYGLTVSLAGLSPEEFLFDAVRFGLFAAGVALVLLPTLVVGFVVAPPTPAVAGILALAGLLAGAAGLVLSDRAGRRWARRYRM